MKNEISKKIEKQKKLKYLLVSRGYNENDLRIESLLCFCERILKSFLYSNIRKSTTLISDTIGDTNTTSNSIGFTFDIVSELKNLHSLLNNNIITSHKLEKIFTSTKGNSRNSIELLMLEPYLFYHNYIMSVFEKDIKKSENKRNWLPEYLAIQIIHILKNERGISFHKFSFLENFNFNIFFETYNKTNLIIKKHIIETENRTNKLAEVDTLITEMEDLSLLLVDSVFNTKYAK